jgi:hypothetical protein
VNVGTIMRYRLGLGWQQPCSVLRHRTDGKRMRQLSTGREPGGGAAAAVAVQFRDPPPVLVAVSGCPLLAHCRTRPVALPPTTRSQAHPTHSSGRQRLHRHRAGETGRGNYRERRRARKERPAPENGAARDCRWAGMSLYHATPCGSQIALWLCPPFMGRYCSVQNVSPPL